MAWLLGRLRGAGVIAEDYRPEAVINIGNVADYAYAAGIFDISSDRVVRPGDFPNVAPPFNQIWMEYAVPSGALGEEQLASTTGDKTFRITHVGAVLEAVVYPGGPYQGALSDTVGEGWAWMGRIYMRTDDGGLGVSPDEQAVVAGPDGSFDKSYVYSSVDDRDHPGGMLLPFFPVFLALSFMHCKNVVRREVELPRAERRQYERQHGKPARKHYVLDIDPMKRVLQSEGGIEQNGLKKALHICRGHFSTYGKDGRGKLFGKLEGTFWVPAHVRGSAESGVVTKDYRVKAPA